MQSSRALKPGTVIAGVWRIERVLGEGGFGVTYEARNIKTGDHVALKEYMPSGCCNRDARTSRITPTAGREGEVFHWGRDRFMKEAETLARLHHPSIVRVAGYFEANGTAYMALAYEPGGTLKDWLGTLARRPTQDEIDALLRPLLDALKEVHALFLLHRDIKPDNIMMRARPATGGQPQDQQEVTPVLIDFGAVRSAVAGHTQTLGGVSPAATSAFAVVSDGYSPPEQYDPGGRMMGPASDIYALGATIYTALTGDRPPSASSRHFSDAYQPLATRLVGAGYRAEFVAGIDRALAVHPKDRPQSAMEFGRALAVPDARAGVTPRLPEAALTEARTEVANDVKSVTFTGVPSGSSAVEQKPRSRAGLLVAAGVALLVLLGGGWWALVYQPQQRLRAEVIEASARKANEAREIAERQRFATQKAEEDRRRAEAEAKRKAEEEAARRRAEEAERQRLAALKAEEDRRRAEAEAKRRAEEDARRRAEEAEWQRLAALKAEEDRRRAEAEAKRRATDPIAALIPGSRQSARDRTVDGSECPECPELVVVPAGSFTMGSPTGEAGRDSDEGPQHTVTIRQPFAVGKFEVTFAEWEACYAERESGGCQDYWNDQGWGSGRRPVINVTWSGAKRYAAWLSAKTGKPYRLLSEAEWEYAARAGSPARWSFGDRAADLGQHAWFSSNSGSRTQPVGGKAANPWGLHDMHGNVSEWVEDCWHASYDGAPSDGSAWIAACPIAFHRIRRGGYWGSPPAHLRSANRNRSVSLDALRHIGFRVGRTLGP